MAFYYGKNCIWCRCQFGPKKGKSKGHLFPSLIGGSVTVRNECKKCNEKIGDQIESPLHSDYFINRGKLSVKKQIEPRMVKRIKVNPHLSFDGRLEKIIFLPLSDGKNKEVRPNIDETSYRAIATIGFRAAALGLRDLIFDPVFNDLRNFILDGTPNMVENGIYATSFERNWKGNHIVRLEFKRPNLVITILLFNAFQFLIFLKLDRDIKIVEFQIAQLLDPKLEAGLFLRDGQQKFKFITSLEGIHVDSLFESLYSNLGQEPNLS